MEKEKIERFLNKGWIKLLADTGDSRVFCYNGIITEVDETTTTIFNQRFGETIILNSLVVQITEFHNGEMRQ